MKMRIYKWRQFWRCDSPKIEYPEFRYSIDARTTQFHSFAEASLWADTISKTSCTEHAKASQQ
jgi:hypothetical protein